MVTTTPPPVRVHRVLPGQTAVGLLLAGALLGAWLGLLWLGFFALPDGPARWILLPLLLAAITVVDVGLFITAHDAMHGSLAPGRPWLNVLVGTVASVVFAGFSFSRLRAAHHAHHAHVATDRDPDFCGDGTAGFLRWFATFVRHYLSVGQLLVMALIAQVFFHIWRAPQLHVLLLWALPSVLASVQLFYFGTWLPHRRPPGGYRNAWCARSNDFPTWLSLLTCFHFGYHEEHHAFPGIPWWRLPAVRRARLAGAPLPVNPSAPDGIPVPNDEPSAGREGLARPSPWSA